MRARQCPVAVHLIAVLRQGRSDEARWAPLRGSRPAEREQPSGATGRGDTGTVLERQEEQWPT